MSASNNQPPSSRQPPASSPGAQSPATPDSAPVAPPSLLADALSGAASTASSLPQPLRTADILLRRAATLRDETEIPDGLAERAIAKCLTVALDGSMAGEVVV